MIYNFICIQCKKFKSYGRPRKDGKYVCYECLKNKEVKNEGNKH